MLAVRRIEPTDTGGSGPSLLPRTTWCWVVAPAPDGQLSLIEVDVANESFGEVGRFTLPGSGFNGSFHTGGLARLGDTLVLAGYTGNGFDVLELDLGTWQAQNVGAVGYTMSVASDQGQLYTECGVSDAWCAYDDAAALAAGTPNNFRHTDLHASRYGLSQGNIYGAWHSTDEIEVVDATTGTLVRTIALEDYDTWVWGVSVADGKLHLIDDGRGAYSAQGVRLAVFDEATGVNLQNVFLPRSPRPSGLWCEPATP